MTGLQRIELSRSRVVELLTELGEDLASQGVKGRLFVVGGAAMALAFNTARTTADVDAVFEPKSKVYDAARRLADRHGDLSADWLNDAVKGFLPQSPDAGAELLLDLPGLAVSVPSPQFLLALKVQAARIEIDQEDIRLLAGILRIETADEILSIAEHIVGRDRLKPSSQFLIQQMFRTQGKAPPIRTEGRAQPE